MIRLNPARVIWRHAKRLGWCGNHGHTEGLPLQRLISPIPPKRHHGDRHQPHDPKTQLAHGLRAFDLSKARGDLIGGGLKVGLDCGAERIPPRLRHLWRARRWGVKSLRRVGKKTRRINRHPPDRPSGLRRVRYALKRSLRGRFFFISRHACPFPP